MQMSHAFSTTTYRRPQTYLRHHDTFLDISKSGHFLNRINSFENGHTRDYLSASHVNRRSISGDVDIPSSAYIGNTSYRYPLFETSPTKSYKARQIRHLSAHPNSNNRVSPSSPSYISSSLFHQSSNLNKNVKYYPSLVTSIITAGSTSARFISPRFSDNYARRYIPPSEHDSTHIHTKPESYRHAAIPSKGRHKARIYRSNWSPYESTNGFIEHHYSSYDPPSTDLYPKYPTTKDISSNASSFNYNKQTNWRDTSRYSCYKSQEFPSLAAGS
ncbi:unnamed protein product, partial [Protopolystoma xenopodis]